MDATPRARKLGERSGPPAWRTIPSWALVGTIDQVIPRDELMFMAERAGAHIVRVGASHPSTISHHSAVTKLIIEAAARATG